MLCQFWLCVDYTASTASIFNLFILSLDRYWSITSPLRYLRRRTKKRALIMISMAWSGAFMWCIPILGWRYFVNNGKKLQPGNLISCIVTLSTNILILQQSFFHSHFAIVFQFFQIMSVILNLQLT